MLLNLPDVTLVLIETREHELARLALDECEARATFGDVLIFTDHQNGFLKSGRRIITVPDWPDKMGWSRCYWQEVAPHVRTSHALNIQWDSWIVDPSMWRDEFLDYDLIGAPWWYKDGMNVGNGGFCLRSTKLMRYLRANRDRLPCTNALDDDLLCRRYRPTLQEAGFVWAPENVALDFSFECIRPDPNARHFGFHAAFNFRYGCQNDEAKLLQRARLMLKSTYMTVSNPYFWQGFAREHPDIVAKLQAEDGIEFDLPQTRAQYDAWLLKQGFPILTDDQWREIERRKGQTWTPRQASV